MARAVARIGWVIRTRLIPQPRIAVISLWRDNMPRVSSVAMRTASGVTWLAISGDLVEEIEENMVKLPLCAGEFANFFQEVDNKVDGDKGADAEPHEFEKGGSDIAIDNCHCLPPGRVVSPRAQTGRFRANSTSGMVCSAAVFLKR